MVVQLALFYYCCARNGLAISSVPSTGQIIMTAVPRQTTSPSVRVASVNLYGSSGSGGGAWRGVDVRWGGGRAEVKADGRVVGRCVAWAVKTGTMLEGGWMG